MVGASWCERSRRSSRLLVYLMLFSRLNVLRCYFANAANRPKVNTNDPPELEVGIKELAWRPLTLIPSTPVRAAPDPGGGLDDIIIISDIIVFFLHFRPRRLFNGTNVDKNIDRLFVDTHEKERQMPAKCPQLLVGNFHLPLGNVVGSIPTPTRKSFFPCNEESRSLYSERLALASATLRCR